jgi:hypothetical protein
VTSRAACWLGQRGQKQLQNSCLATSTFSQGQNKTRSHELTLQLLLMLLLPLERARKKGGCAQLANRLLVYLGAWLAGRQFQLQQLTHSSIRSLSHSLRVYLSLVQSTSQGRKLFFERYHVSVAASGSVRTNIAASKEPH